MYTQNNTVYYKYLVNLYTYPCWKVFVTFLQNNYTKSWASELVTTATSAIQLKLKC